MIGRTEDPWSRITLSVMPTHSVSEPISGKSLRVPLISALLATLVAVAAMFAVVPAGASTPTAGDKAQISLGATGGPLRARGVRVRALRPATYSKGRLTLPVGDISTPGVTTGRLVLRGGVKLTHGKHRIKIQGMMVEVAAGRVKITAKVGSKRMSLLSGKLLTGGANATLGTVSFKAGRTMLTHGAERAIRRKLHTRKARTRRLGAVQGASAITVEPDKPRDPGDGLPLSDFNFADQVELARPVGANDLTAPQPDLVLWPRDSWLTYIASGGGTTVEPPATPGPAITQQSEHKCPFDGPKGDARPYSYNFTFASGWFDEGSGTGVLRYSGALRFRYPAHGLNIRIANPIVEINGASSRVLVDASDPYAGRRTDLVSVPDLYAQGPSQKTFDGLLTAHAAGVLGGLYTPGSKWGCVEIGVGK